MIAVTEVNWPTAVIIVSICAMVAFVIWVAVKYT